MNQILIQRLRNFASRALGQSPVASWPVRVKKGIAKGARWTAFPYSSYWRGNTEMDVEAAINLHGVTEGGSCWDLGTHFGIYTVGMGMAVGPRGQVAAFEPDPISFAKCKRHVEMNQLTWCKLFNAGASEHPSKGRLIVGNCAGASTSHLAYEDEGEHSTGELIEITLIQLDQLVENGEIRKPDFIKVDVEGHGAKALAGARRSIAAARPTILMSFHSEWELGGTRELLEAIGYSPKETSGTALPWKSCLFRTAILRPE